MLPISIIDETDPGYGWRAWEGTADLRELVRAGHLGKELDTGTGNLGKIGIIDCAKAGAFTDTGGL